MKLFVYQATRTDERTGKICGSRFYTARYRLPGDAKYCLELRRQLGLLLKECGWPLPAQVTSESFRRWRQG